MTKRKQLLLITLLALLVVAIILSASTGTVGISLHDIFNKRTSGLHWNVWWNIRLPRIVLGALVGAILAMSGAAMQGLFRNPLADPALLGLANGAGLGISLLIVFGSWLQHWLGQYSQFIAAFIGALIASCIVFMIGNRYKGREAVLSLLLAGLAINMITGACSGLLAYIASDEQLRQLSLWGMGSLANALWPSTLVAAVLIVLSLSILQSCAKGLDLMQLGDHTAYSAGLDVTRLRRRLILAISLGVGASVALSGVIGFVGLLVPHILRLWSGPAHRFLLPASMLGGALLLITADTLSRILVSPAELPVGLLTSLLGGPYFLWLLIKRNRRYGI